MMIIQNTLNLYYVDAASGIARPNSAGGGKAPSSRDPAHSVVRLEDRLWFSGHGRVFGSEIKPSAWSECFGIGTPASLTQAGTPHGALMEETSVAMNESYLNEPLYQVRGSSLKNLWAVGNRYALHKKTP